MSSRTRNRNRSGKRPRTVILRLEQLETRLPLAAPDGLADLAGNADSRFIIDINAEYATNRYDVLYGDSNLSLHGADDTVSFNASGVRFFVENSPAIGPAPVTPSGESDAQFRRNASFVDQLDQERSGGQAFSDTTIGVDASAKDTVQAGEIKSGTVLGDVVVDQNVVVDQTAENVDKEETKLEPLTRIDRDRYIGFDAEQLTHLEGVEPLVEPSRAIPFPEPNEGLLALATIADSTVVAVIELAAVAPAQSPAVSHDEYFVDHQPRRRPGWSAQSAASESRQHVASVAPAVASEQTDHSESTPFVRLPGEVSSLVAHYTARDDWAGESSAGVYAVAEEVGRDAESGIVTDVTPIHADAIDRGQRKTQPIGIRDSLLASYHPLTVLLGASLVSAHLLVDSQSRPGKRAKTRQRLGVMRMKE